MLLRKRTTLKRVTAATSRMKKQASALRMMTAFSSRKLLSARNDQNNDDNFTVIT